MKQFALGKQKRLKSRKLIEELFSKGKRVNVFPLCAFYMFKQNENVKSKLQCGVGAGTRNFKKAVDRNRIKRVIRETYRLQKNELENKMTKHSKSLVLFFIYTGKELPESGVVREKMAIILQKLLIIADENLASDS
jgi:ribonuclease P protein component